MKEEKVILCGVFREPGYLYLGWQTWGWGRNKLEILEGNVYGVKS